MHYSLRDALAEWAASKPLVNRLWIFGSRARGDHRPDSDLDIAIELDLSAANGCDDSGGFATWCFDTKGWREELEQIAGHTVDMQHFAGDETPTIKGGLEQASELIYIKPAG